MRHLKIVGLLAVSATALTAFFGVASASAEVLWTRNSGGTLTTLPINSNIESSLESGTSTLLKDTAGGVNDTCTGSTLSGTMQTNSGGHANGPVSALTFTGCSHTTHVLATGTLTIKRIAGTTNGTVISNGARVTFKSTVFGLSCVAATGAGTTIGTLTGASSSTSHATIDINSVIAHEPTCGGDSTWTGSYLVTSPLGLVVE